MPDNIEIDDVAPVSQAFMADTRDSFLLQHGGVLTRVHFDTVEVMSVQEFVNKEVARIRKDPGSDDMYVLRDSITKSSAIIYKDQVIKYNVTNIEDVPLDMLSEYLSVYKSKIVYPNIGFPVVAYNERADGSKSITVHVEGKKTIFRGSPSVYGKDFNLPIYLPPIWFKVHMTSARAISNTFMCCVPEKCVNCLDTKLYHLPLPNIFGSDFSICQGSVHIVDNPVEVTTDGVAIALALEQSLRGERNDHILNGEDFTAILGTAYDECTSKYKEDIERRIAAKSGSARICGMLRVLCVLTTPNGWMNLKFRKAEMTAERFLTDASVY